ncbi:hypothetical protein OG539_32620 [Actinacidiphila glaucinigra]|uniref:hypothetical protein n=1 Tax=Actinacidiphila glaucinigra TaxID=235986 RepID=UPI0032498355
MTTAVRYTPDHGTASRYRGDPRPKKSWAPCRCEPCRAAYRRRHKAVVLRKARGGEGRHPLEPVAAHIEKLIDSGWTVGGIEAAARVDRRGICNMRTGRQKTVQYATAARILALQPGGQPYLTDATGTRRRLRALATIGYSVTWTASQAGLSARGCQYICNGEWGQVTWATRQAIAAVYDQHAGTPGPSNWTRAYAAKRDWRDPQFWEDWGRIDDPTYDPAETQRPLKRNDLAALRRADVEHLASFGLTPEAIAERVDLELSTIRDLVNAWRNGRKRDRRKELAA